MGNAGDEKNTALVKVEYSCNVRQFCHLGCIALDNVQGRVRVASSNKKIGMKVGADAYAPKLVVKEFSTTLIALISGTDQTIIDKERHVA